MRSPLLYAPRYVIGFIALYIYLIYKLPDNCQQDQQILEAYRFIIYRFRPDYWYWGVIYLIRNGFMTFTTIIDSANPYGFCIH